MSKSEPVDLATKMALSNQSHALNRTSDEGKLPCCYTDLYPGEEHFREYKRAQKEKKEFVPKQPPGGMSSGDGATVTVLDMDETGVKGRARRRRSVGGSADTRSAWLYGEC